MITNPIRTLWIFMDIDDNIKVAGNPQGLRLLAAELIEQSLKHDHNLPVHLNNTGFIVDSGPVSIETTILANQAFAEELQQQEVKATSSGVGCIVFLLAIVALIIMGIIFLFRMF